MVISVFIDLNSQMYMFIISFVFVFAIVFGLLSLTNIFKNRNIHAIIALVFAAFSATYLPLVEMLGAMIPIAVILFIILFFIGVLRRMFGEDPEKLKENALPLIVSLALLFLLLGILAPSIPSGMTTNDFNNILLIVGLVFFAVIFYIAFKKGGTTP